MTRLTREQSIKATAPDCARFDGYNYGNAMVFSWHRMRIVFPQRRLHGASLERMAVQTGEICMNSWDNDDLREYAAMLQFRCSDIGYDEQLERVSRVIPSPDIITFGFAR